MICHRLKPASLLAVFALLLGLLAGCAAPPRTQRPDVIVRDAPPPTSVQPEPATPTLRKLADEAAALRPFAVSGLTLRFLDAVRSLPPAGTRLAYINETTREYFSAAERAALPEAQRARLAEVSLDEYRYYYTKYGSPLAYLRPLEIAAAHGMTDLQGRRVLDFGYGGIGHLRLMASLGAHVVGVDPDSYLDALYSEPRDQGTVAAMRESRRASGTLTLAHGYWPKDAPMVARVGGAFDLILSKNTLKKGYVKPERRTDRRQQVNLGVTDEVFIKALYDALKPGGLLVIYNVSPRQADKGGYNPQADGRSPWPRESYERAGFQVLAINTADDEAIRNVGRALGWDRTANNEPIDLNTSIFALYTVLVRPR
ncbi:MAG TPA: hypothetical protein VFV17_04505 [Usitatibacteraceae bacterium]|nr:hypothetical protein [Usitatibacteraceae bacterium]